MAASPRSTLGELSVLADELSEALSALLDESGIHEVELNPPGSSVFIVGIPWYWDPLAREHQPLVAVAQRLLDLWEALASRAVVAAAPSRVERFKEGLGTMRQVVEQTGGAQAHHSSVENVRRAVSEALQAQRDMLEDLPSAHGSGEVLVVPDTNAALYQPAIEEWQPHDSDWTAVIVPQVIRELDEKKMRRDEVGEAATTFIRRLKEYGRRGETFEGVPLRDGARLREVAVDADMADSLPWLRAGHADDELLASVLELKWQDLTASVLLVTRDRNLQNKARLARVAWKDMEDIASPRERTKKPQRPAPEKVEEARQRLSGALPWARSKLGVPPESRATDPKSQSWTVQATPVSVHADFAERVLGAEAPEWAATRVAALFADPVPLPSSGPSEETGAYGFVISRKLLLPSQGAVSFVADAGGIAGVRYSVQADASGGRIFILTVVEEEFLRPLVETCVQALELLGATGPALIEVWVAGVSSSQVHTAGHPTLRGERDGWLSDGLLHMGSEIGLPADGAAVDKLVARWGREFARTAGIRARG